MDLIHAGEMPWGESLVAQRAGGEVAHKRLFEGADGHADNHMLVMAREPATYFSPRHRHPWDQIRFCLEGKIPIAKGLYVDGGEIAYFPESAPYGPQEGGKDRIVLLLQFGGASGQGFIGPDLLGRARRELAEIGQFDGGVYTRETAQGRDNRDAYEAIWHHVTGAAPHYASPAYKTPIVMRPEALAWHATDAAGVAVKQIGLFPHRGLAIRAWQLAPAARHELAAEPALRFLFVTAGSGRIGAEPLRPWSAVRLAAGEAASIQADETLELIELSVAEVSSLKGQTQE